MTATLLKNCRVIDCTGGPLRDNVEILIEGELIRAIAPAGTHSAATTIDMKGWTVMPGLSNLHAHLALSTPMGLPPDPTKGPAYTGYRCLRSATQALQAGVTLLRSTGDPGGAAIDLRDAIAAGIVQGPRIFASGQSILSSGGHGHRSPGAYEADGPYEFRRAAREQIRRGADLIKVIVSGGMATPGTIVESGNVKPDELKEAVDIAHQFGKHITIHSGGSAPIAMGVECGIDCLEHGYVFDERIAELLSSSRTWLVPTLAVTHSDEWIQRNGSERQKSSIALAKDDHARTIRMAHDKGVRMAVGTDIPPGDLINGVNATVHEVELLNTIAGLNPLQALQAATINAAQIVGASDRLGTVETGKFADLIAMPGDPLSDLTSLRSIGFVMKGGTVIRTEIA